jgi:hypothetical protein
MKMQRMSGVRWVLCGLAIGASAWVTPVARADDFTRRANALYADIAQGQRSDLIVLPAIAKMKPVPASVNRLESAMLLPAGAAGWGEAKAWAEGAEQQAVLAAIREVTKEEDFRKALAWGQPYGAAGVSPELVRARLYTELGEPPTLGAAQFLYLEGLDRAACLVNVEATRLAADGKVGEATELLTKWLFLCRQIADREMTREAAWGLLQMDKAYERLRDVVYADFRGARKLTTDGLQATLARLDDERGYAGLTRLRLARGDRVAAEQVISRGLVDRGGVNEATFAPTLARLRTTGKPLRLFAEAADAKAASGAHAGFFDAQDALKRAADDFAARWTLGWFDPRMKQPWEYSRLSPSRHALVLAAFADQSELYNLRQLTQVEAVGTRTALGIYGYVLSNRNFPPTVSACRPVWIKVVEADPFNPNRDRGRVPEMEYYVPNKVNAKRRDERATPEPQRVNVIVPESGLNFSVNVGEDQFIVYSWGSDNAKGWADRVQNTAKVVQGADYLVWPPVISLYRQHLTDTGQLK